MSLLVTGAKGLIGSALVRRLKEAGNQSLILVDEYNSEDEGLHLRDLFRWLDNNMDEVDFIFHLGANTNTLESDKNVFDYYNVGYSKSLWYRAIKNRIPIIYASSAATYGDGSNGYSDETNPNDLHPLNQYGISKNDFDKFVLSHTQSEWLPFWAGLKFFNVYGYNESHKGKMASMVYHGYNQVKQTDKIRLFSKGQHMRDFIWVEDVVDCMLWMMKKRPRSGLYNVGTGESRKFSNLAHAVYSAVSPDSVVKIEYFEMPEEIKNQYQDFTQADITKLRTAGYDKPFTILEEGIKKYIQILENERKTVSI